MNSKTLGKGRSLIFLHGWGGDASAFLFLAESLSDKYKTTVLDFPSFGGSPEPERPYGVGDFADEVLALMDKSDIEKATFIGHSFGGRVALEIAAKMPERAEALVLIDSAGVKPRRGLKYYFKVYLHKLLKKFKFKGLGGSEDYKKLSPVMKRTFVNVVNYNQTAILKDIRQPTAVFWGKNDTETPPYMAKILKKNIVSSEIFWLNGGHFAYLEDNAYFCAVLTAFLRETDKLLMTEKTTETECVS